MAILSQLDCRLDNETENRQQGLPSVFINDGAGACEIKLDRAMSLDEGEGQRLT